MREDLTEAEREGAGVDGEARRSEDLERENSRLREALAATQAEAKRLARDLGQRYAIPIAPAMIRPPRRRGDRESAIDLAAEIARARDAAALAAEQHELALAASQAHLNLVQTANAILATSEARLRLALAAGRLGTWELVPSTREFVASAICKANFGRRPEEPFLYDDLVASIHPDDVEYQRGEVEQSVEAEREFDIEYRCRWPDRTVHWVNVRGDVVADPDGAKRLIGVSVEVTDRREAEERNKILLHELNHRVKNTLATIQSIASQTGRNATSREEFLQAFELRLLAISKTHNLLTLSEWRGADLYDILADELAPYRIPDERVHLRGPPVTMPSNAVLMTGLVMHELATNAAKYGALSAPQGWIEISWRVERGRLYLTWDERGGPPVDPPVHRGFGSRLIERGLRHELGGSVALEFAHNGLHCAIDVPLPAVPA